ncbi:hypothetical protein [Cerasicoccus fimbriatus]|uniref:hypothetical protein n=1 Tax=Cerasicoccus fimbriatus TaxID=3014554 RepID=UPI0022B40076|nr:hypothetical protein [Cerasicoccus sp. TK19100]
MKYTVCLLALAAAMVGCKNYEDAGEKAVLSQEPMSDSTGAVTQDLNQRQTNDVEGMEQSGLLNSYEEQQMEGAIGNTGN